MSYKVEELFKFEETEGGYVITEYLKKDDPTVTAIEIPSEFNGRPITMIEKYCFSLARHLREIVLPDSVKFIGGLAFAYCLELRAIRLPKHVIIRPTAFKGCEKIPAEIVMAGLVGSPEDISAPIDYFRDEPLPVETLAWNNILRPDVFELIIKYDSFREMGMDVLYNKIVRNKLFSHFEALENAGRSPDAAQTDRLIEFSAENGYTEMTAFLLDYKNRKFGFNEGDNFEL